MVAMAAAAWAEAGKEAEAAVVLAMGVASEATAAAAWAAAAWAEAVKAAVVAGFPIRT